VKGIVTKMQLIYRCQQTISSFKMVPKADAAYLEFRTHTSRYSDSQSTVHITRW